MGHRSRPVKGLRVVWGGDPPYRFLTYGVETTIRSPGEFLSYSRVLADKEVQDERIEKAERKPGVALLPWVGAGTFDLGPGIRPRPDQGRRIHLRNRNLCQAGKLHARWLSHVREGDQRQGRPPGAQARIRH